MSMGKSQVVQALELEYEEPIQDIIVGFAEMGYTQKDTARILGINPDTVRLWLWKTNTPSPFTHGNTGKHKSPHAGCRVNGMSIYELSSYYSVGVPTITQWIREGKLQCD